MYTTVRFVTNRAVPPFLVPDASLVVEANGTTLAVLAAPQPDRNCRRLRRQGLDQSCVGSSANRSFPAKYSQAGTTERHSRFWTACMMATRWWSTLAMR